MIGRVVKENGTVGYAKKNVTVGREVKENGTVG